jgi:sialic acid synthase SpsE
MLEVKAKQHGIDFLCTGFSPSGYRLINKHVKAHKVASAELTHVQILETVRDLGKPIFLSTGGHGMMDIHNALELLRGSNKLTLMYCVAAYPATKVDLRCIDLLKTKFKCDVGFSDHTTDYFNIPYYAVINGATVVEKHFKYKEMHTPDAAHSILPDQFREMVKRIRGDIPPAEITWLQQERGMITKHNRRLIATRDVPKGGTFEIDMNFGIYRSLKEDLHAMSPFRVGQINGKTATKDIKADDGVGPGDF